VPSYLVEAYLPRSGAREAEEAGRRARAAAAGLTREGASIRYVRTTFLPEDETCFHLFEAACPALVEAAARRAQLGRARVLPAIEGS
jgi:hypothetical protein